MFYDGPRRQGALHTNGDSELILDPFYTFVDTFFLLISHLSFPRISQLIRVLYCLKNYVVLLGRNASHLLITLNTATLCNYQSFESKMSTPVHEFPQPSFPARGGNTSLSDDEGTLSGEYDRNNVNHSRQYFDSMDSKTQSRDDEQRMHDDLAIVKAERIVSNAQSSNNDANFSKSISMDRSRSRVEPIDQFDVNTNPVHEKTATFRPPDHPIGNTARVFKKIHESSFLVRYFTYIVPIVALILVPLMLGALVFEKASVGGVRLMWFSVWLEIVWLTLWGGRVSLFSFSHWLEYGC